MERTKESEPPMTDNFIPDFTKTGDVFVSRDGTEWRFRNDAKCVTQPITLSRIKNTSDSSSFWTSGRYVTDRTEHDFDIVSQYTPSPPAVRYACSTKVAAVGDTVKNVGYVLASCRVAAIKDADTILLESLQSPGRYFKAPASQLEFVPDVTPTAAERDVPQENDVESRTSDLREIVKNVLEDAARTICHEVRRAARHAPKDDGAEDAAELRRQLDELEIASQEHVAYCCYDHHEDGATTIHLCDSDTKGAFKVYRRFLKADIDRLASPDPAKIDAAWREFIGATHGAPNTPPAKPDATQKWPRFWRCRDTNELWFCGSSSSPLMYRASGTSETVASNFTVETVWYAGNKAGDVYETDADGNELTRHEQANRQIIEANVSADSESFAVEESRKTQPMPGEGAKVEQGVKRYKVPDDYVGVIRHKGYGHVEVVTAADHDAAIAELQSEVSRLSSLNRRLEDSLESKDAKAEERIHGWTELEAYKEAAELNKQEWDKARSIVASQASEIDRATRGIVSLREQYASVSELLTRVSDERDALQQRAERAEAELAEVNHKYAEARKELDWYIKEASSFFDRLRELGHEPGGLVIDHIWVCDELKKART